MVPTSPSATTLNRFVPLATCSGRPRDSSAGSVTAEPLLARVLMKPPNRPAMAARSTSSHPTKRRSFRKRTVSTPRIDRGVRPFFDEFLDDLYDLPLPAVTRTTLPLSPNPKPLLATTSCVSEVHLGAASAFADARLFRKQMVPACVSLSNRGHLTQRRHQPFE